MYKRQTKVIWNARTQRFISGMMMNVEKMRNQKPLTVYGIVSKKLIGRVIVVINLWDIWRWWGRMQDKPSSTIKWHGNSKHQKYDFYCHKYGNYRTRVATSFHIITQQPLWTYVIFSRSTSVLHAAFFNISVVKLHYFHLSICKNIKHHANLLIYLQNVSSKTKSKSIQKNAVVWVSSVGTVTGVPSGDPTKPPVQHSL